VPNGHQKIGHGKGKLPEAQCMTVVTDRFVGFVVVIGFAGALAFKRDKVLSQLKLISH
tara:strand:+ start:367 stop:540 length:174 start_codon:yes stop_codon:yes gene_type:complete